jgi:hypothetical protein
MASFSNHDYAFASGNSKISLSNDKGLFHERLGGGAFVAITIINM